MKYQIRQEPSRSNPMIAMFKVFGNINEMWQFCEVFDTEERARAFCKRYPHGPVESKVIAEIET